MWLKGILAVDHVRELASLLTWDDNLSWSSNSLCSICLFRFLILSVVMSNSRNQISNKENLIQGIIYISDGKDKKLCLTVISTTVGIAPWRALSKAEVSLKTKRGKSTPKVLPDFRKNKYTCFFQLSLGTLHWSDTTKSYMQGNMVNAFWNLFLHWCMYWEGIGRSALLCDILIACGPSGDWQ